MGKQEVTQKAFMEVMGYNPSRLGSHVEPSCGERHLGNGDGVLPEIDHHGIRIRHAARGVCVSLPTEAEWEYACRAGTKTRYPHGDDPDFRLFEEFAWHSGNELDRAPTRWHPRPNPWGFAGMLGGVYEWCLGGMRDTLGRGH